MSFYRTFIAAVAAMGLATAVMAADATTATTDTNTMATQEATQATDKVNLNTATAKDLMKVEGLNAAKAKAIVSYRKKHGDFKTMDDLKMVKGFKKMKEDQLKTLQDKLTIG